ncbi:MAG TPA: PorT family protein [Candidatus Alistipes intestinipullorum]|nr:PorT family protein [Candidatus Alistipes intestinipullorum]
MKQDQNNDWIEAMRQSLRDAELTPPADGWARLQRELGSPAPERVPEPATDAPRRPAWRIVWPQVAAVAAAVLICIVAGGILLRSDRIWVQEGDVIASAADKKSTSASMPPQSESERLSKTLAETVGLSQEPSDTPSSSIRRQTLLAAATSADRVPAETERSARTESVGVSRSAVTGKTAPAIDGTGIPTASSARAASLSEPSTPVDEEPAPTSVRTPADGADASTRRAVAQAASSSSTRSRNVSDELFVAQRQPRKRASFSLHAGGSLSGNNTDGTYRQGVQMSISNDVSSMVGTGDNMVLTQRFDARDNAYRHHQPLSFGLSVSKEFPHGLSLESGVIYTLVRSDVQTRYSSEDVSQKLHFIGIPLRLNWRFFERGRLSLYIGAGGMAEKCVSAKFGTTSVNESALQWSALAAVGLQYRLGEVVGLYFEPEGSYYFTETRLRTVRTESPMTLSLRLGVRLSF